MANKIVQMRVAASALKIQSEFFSDKNVKFIGKARKAKTPNQHSPLNRADLSGASPNIQVPKNLSVSELPNNTKPVKEVKHFQSINI